MTDVLSSATWFGLGLRVTSTPATPFWVISWVGGRAKILGSTHTGIPVDVPVIQSDLKIKPVRVEPWADIGTNSTILPGVTIGKGSVLPQ